MLGKKGENDDLLFLFCPEAGLCLTWKLLHTFFVSEDIQGKVDTASHNLPHGGEGLVERIKN